MNKAVLLDRDGVINRERGDYTYRIEDLEVNPGVVEALRIFRDKGYKLIVITNQGGIAKGLYSREEMEALNKYLTDIMEQQGIELLDIYYCPHHPSHGNCICRKPDSLLLEKAIARYGLDASSSYFIGDTERDITAGTKAGVMTIRTEPNSNLLTIVNLVK